MFRNGIVAQTTTVKERNKSRKSPRFQFAILLEETGHTATVLSIVWIILLWTTTVHVLSKLEIVFMISSLVWDDRDGSWGIIMIIVCYLMLYTNELLKLIYKKYKEQETAFVLILCFLLVYLWLSWTISILLWLCDCEEITIGAS